MSRRLILLLLYFLLTSSFISYADDYTSINSRYENLSIVSCNKFLNIRSRPSTDSKIVGIVKTGGACEVITEGKVWCLVKSGDITGYVKKEYLVFGDEAITKAVSTAYKEVCLQEESQVFSEKSLESKVWLKSVRGTKFEVISEDSEWLEVDITGTSGYISQTAKMSKYYTLPVATKTYGDLVEGERADMVKCAMRFLGNRYVWGGNDPNTGADCSGFVRYVYKQIRPDIWLPRVSYEQCYIGKSISSLDMRPGDLLFYAYNDGTVHHVAMYIGNGMIIHAASRTQGIILSPWNYQVPKYIRNIIND